MQNILDDRDGGGKNEQRHNRQRKVVECTRVVLSMRHTATTATPITSTSTITSLGHSVTHSVTHSLSHSLTQSVTYSVSHLLSQSLSHSLGQSVGRTILQRFRPFLTYNMLSNRARVINDGRKKMVLITYNLFFICVSMITFGWVESCFGDGLP